MELRPRQISLSGWFLSEVRCGPCAAVTCWCFMSAVLRLLSIGPGVASRVRNLYYRILGTRLLGYVWMQQIEIPRRHHEIEIGAGAALDRGVVLLCSGEAT